MRGRFRCEFRGNLNGAWDANRLEQLLSNLGGNAIEHGARDTPINIRVHDAGEEVLLEMHNQGPPIPSELLPFVFAPFRQGSAQEGAMAGGLGLGLYISDQIVRAHGGSIVARSTAAEGTTFSVRVPRRPAEAAEGAITEDNHSGKLILLVDDDSEWTDLLGMFLQAEGFQVSVAYNGQEALDLMARVRPSLALVDLNMPIMDGWKLLQHLAIDPVFAKVPIALVTSVSKPPADYVVFRKPISDLDALLTFVRHTVARTR